jgi:serine/threonine protein kinase
VQIISGMKELRRHGFTHRDLKPENILIHNNSVKICDFGLTVTCREGNKLIRYCGTPLYMSPQVILKKYYTSKADIWSLGIIFYEILFGYTPWACRDEKSYVPLPSDLESQYQIEHSQISLRYPDRRSDQGLHCQMPRNRRREKNELGRSVSAPAD